MITEVPVEEIRPSVIGHTIVRREAVGVVAAVIPWNYPQALAAMKIAPALAAGCTVVLKASPETALDALVFAEAAVDAGLPSGVLNIVDRRPGDGRLPGGAPGHRQGRVHRFDGHRARGGGNLRPADAPGHPGTRR